MSAAPKNKVQLAEKAKAHLGLLRSQLDVALMDQLNETIIRSTDASDKLGKKVFWLNVVVAALTLVVAAAALGELFQ